MLPQEKATEVGTSPKHTTISEHEPETPEEANLTWAKAIALRCSFPGMSRRAAEIVLGKIGLKMSRFPCDNHLALLVGQECRKYEKENSLLHCSLVIASL